MDSRISLENNCRMYCFIFWIFKHFCYYLYRSPDPTTDSEITNPDLFANQIVCDDHSNEKHCKTCWNWSKNLIKCKFIFSELVIGSGEQEFIRKQKLPKLVNSLKRSLESMVLSEFLSYNFKISTKSWMPPVSLESLAFLKRGYISSRTMVFLPFSFSPPISTMVFMVGFKLQARTRSPM